MRRLRISIAGLMLVVGVTALGVLGLKEGTELWASASFTVTVVILLGAILSAVHGRGSRRAFWTGFVLFGWVYLLWIFRPWSYPKDQLDVPRTLTHVLLDFAHERIHVEPQYIPNPNLPVGAASGPPVFFGPPMPMQPAMIIKPGSVYWQGDIESYRQVGHCLTALFFGIVGGAWSAYARERSGREAGSTNGSGAGAAVP
jgi:hypothetical protein